MATGTRRNISTNIKITPNIPIVALFITLPSISLLSKVI